MFFAFCCHPTQIAGESWQLAGGRRFRSRTGIQLEATCADRPERLGLIPERGGLQTLPPAGPARLPSEASRARRAVRSFASN